MKKLIIVIMAMALAASLSISVFGAEFKASADLELYWEYSNDVGGVNDNDKFKSEQLYLTIDGAFEGGMSARLKLDGADIVSSDSKVVTEKIVEEANFTLKNIGGSPLTLVFGKDEMPYGLDYDKYLNDPIAHAFEIDKVWGLHGIFTINNFGNVAAAFYQHRNGSAENELFNNFTARLKVDKLVENLMFEASFAKEEYTPQPANDNQTKFSVGLVYKFIKDANINLEYNRITSLGGTRGYDPSLLTLGLEGKIGKFRLFGRYEKIFEDAAIDVEENFFAAGVAYTPVKNYTISLEVANFNSGDLKDASDLNVKKGTIENSIRIGIRAKF